MRKAEQTGRARGRLSVGVPTLPVRGSVFERKHPQPTFKGSTAHGVQGPGLTVESAVGSAVHLVRCRVQGMQVRLDHLETLNP